VNTKISYNKEIVDLWTQALSEAYIEENISFLIKKNNKVNKKFIRFFNISVFTSFLLILVLFEILIFSTIFYT